VKIKVICPITTKEFENDTKEEVKKFVSDEVQVDAERIEYGTASIEGEYDEALAAPGILKLAEKAQNEGCDGVFISCMGDPAVEAAREILDIPVVGPCRASMLYAADMTHRFSVVTVVDGVVPLIEKVGRQVGLSGKLVSVKSVDIPVLELSDINKLLKALLEKSIEAIERDGAQAIILGCTGMIGVDELLSRALEEKGYSVPVLYPAAVSIRYLESLIKLNMSHSKVAYLPPRQKERNIWDRLK
jgi:allantoin racemase